jgi:7-carboxy-7-deazaguanine synthase
MPTEYPLARNPIFWTLQGEGHLRGFQMAFVRLAGCSVGCAECDTDYGVAERVELLEIVHRVLAVTPSETRDRWVWITGGEPTDHDLKPLLKALRGAQYSTALATSGSRRFIPPVDWLSVSPHTPHLMQRYGSEIKLVDGLGDTDLERWHAANPDDSNDFMYRYVQPLTIGGVESKSSLERCLAFLKTRPNWSLSRQDHRHWSVA